MPETSELLTQDSTTPPDASAGQPIDWEARYKGLNPTINKLQAQLNAKETALQTAVAKAQQLEQGGATALSEAQTTIATLTNDLKTTQTAKQQAETEAATAKAEAAKLQGIQQARVKLTELKATDLLPALDMGALVLDSLDDTAVTAKVTQFRALLANYGAGIATPPPAANLSGAGVPLVTASTTGAPNRDDLYAWVMNPANFNHADYQKNSDAYYATVK